MYVAYNICNGKCSIAESSRPNAQEIKLVHGLVYDVELGNVITARTVLC